ncbi:MAG: glycosyltransferase [Candidatus Limnocylindrales bacterium]
MSRAGLIGAGTTAAVSQGELAFVESSLPGDAWKTYSDILGPSVCSAIDREAYGRARSWYRSGDGDADLTEVRGVSLGRAYELRATAMLVAYLRARTVLANLTRPMVGTKVHVRDAGEEWVIAARSLGLDIDERSRIVRPLASIVPDPGAHSPRSLGRMLASVARPLKSPKVDIVLSESPRWATAYHSSLLRRWPAIAVNPRPGMLLAALVERRRLHVTWLADSLPDRLARGVIKIAESPDPGDAVLRSSFIADLPRLAAWAALGRSFQARLALATQDVTPAVRSVLLGFQAAGGRVITLEHGISGGYAEQVHSLADHLGVWGPIQAAYHRDAGPPSIDVVELGWPRLEAAAAQHRAEQEPKMDIVFFGQPATPLSAGSWPEDALRSHAIVEGYANRHPRRRVAVKLHPATRAYHATVMAHDRAVMAAGDSLSLIRRARVVAVATSTTALEAMAMGRPVIRIATRGYIGPVDFLRDSGAVVSVTDADEFEVAAEQLLSSRSAYARAVELGWAYAGAFVTGLNRPRSAEDRLIELVQTLLAE